MLEQPKVPDFPKTRGNVTLVGPEEPKIDPIAKAKDDIIRLIDGLGYINKHQGEWLRFKFETDPHSPASMQWSTPGIKESLKGRLQRYYFGRHRQLAVIWQYFEGCWNLFVKVT